MQQTILLATHAREADMMRRALERAGLNVVVATGRDGAIEMISKERPAAVVISARFSTGPVDQLVEAVREAGRERVRVLLVDDPSAHPRRVGHSGADVLLLRPVDPSVLLQRLAQFVEAPAMTPVPPPTDTARVRPAFSLARADDALPGFDELLPELDPAAFAAPMRRAADSLEGGLDPTRPGAPARRPANDRGLLRLDAAGLGIDPLAEPSAPGRPVLPAALSGAQAPSVVAGAKATALAPSAALALDEEGVRDLLRKLASSTGERRALIRAVREVLGLDALATAAGARDAGPLAAPDPRAPAPAPRERAPTPAPRRQAPTPAPSSPAAVPSPSAAIPARTRATAPTPPGRRAAPPALDRARIESKWAEVHEADYFTLLEVKREASTEEIELAWKRLHDEFAPDRLSPERRADLASQLRELHEVFDEAHRVLGEPTLRLAYRAHLG